MEHIARDEAFALLKKYNKDPFHIQHALTVEAVMKWYAKELGYGDDGSSAAKRTFSISCSGAVSMVAPQPTVIPYP